MPSVVMSLVFTADASLTVGTPDSSKQSGCDGGGGGTLSTVAGAGATTLLILGRVDCLRIIKDPLVIRSPKPSSCEKA